MGLAERLLYRTYTKIYQDAADEVIRRVEANLRDLDIGAKLEVRIGLKAQGHFDTVTKMLADGASWDDIGRAIGWDPKAAEHWYDLERQYV